MNTRFPRVLLAAALLFGGAACDDPAPIGTGVDAEPAPVRDAEPPPDMAPVVPDAAPTADTAVSDDAAPVMDTAVEPDMAPQPDAAPDMNVIPEPQPIREASQACDPVEAPAGDAGVGDGGAADMGEVAPVENPCALNQTCIDGGCWYDLLPNFYRITDIAVVNPERSGPLLEGFLGVALDNGQLNMLVEPGGYIGNIGSYRWYIGTGSQSGGQYYYFHQYPIQNFDGFWREGDVRTSLIGEEDEPYSGAYWTMEGQTPFVLNVPMGRVTIGDDVVTCFTEIALEVTLTILPPTGPEDPNVLVWVSGFLRASEAEQVNFLLNGAPVDLVPTILQPDDLTLDTDGDGEPDAFPFDFVGTASPVPLSPLEAAEPDGSNRDPNPDYMNPEECEGAGAEDE